MFWGLKVFGVSYLMFLAYSAFKQPISPRKIEVSECAAIDLWSQFRKGLVINMTNPLTPLALMALIPPYIEAGRGGVFNQSVQLGSVLIVAVFIGFSVMSIATEKIGSRMQTARAQRVMQRLAGVTITFFALYLALAKQSL